VVADRGGEQPVADEDHEGHQHERQSQDRGGNDRRRPTGALVCPTSEAARARSPRKKELRASPRADSSPTS
jgi:hypothetical protein